MTAQPDIQELSQARHHLFNIIPLTCTDFNRIKYFNLAFPLVNELHS